MAAKQSAAVRMTEQRWNKNCLFSLNDRSYAENTEMVSKAEMHCSETALEKKV